MPAIEYRKGKIGRVEAKDQNDWVPETCDVELLESLYAWRSADGAKDRRESYRFLHHLPMADLNCKPEDEGRIFVGMAEPRACVEGIARLNGAFGGAGIPDEDREGVYRHLKAHLEEFGLPVPPLKKGSGKGDVERRDVQFRHMGEAGDGRSFEGHLAVFNREANIGDLFIEVVRPGAFSKTIQESDIRFLINHERSKILGRTKPPSGHKPTVQIREDEEGLVVTSRFDERSYERDLMISMKRGDISEGSFGFRPIEPHGEKWSRRADGMPVRELLEVELLDVSIVTFPAYTGTSTSLRSAALLGLGDLGAGIETPAVLAEVLEKFSRGHLTQEEDRVKCASTVEVLRRLEGESVLAGGSPEKPSKEPVRTDHSSADLKRRSRLLRERVDHDVFATEDLLNAVRAPKTAPHRT